MRPLAVLVLLIGCADPAVVSDAALAHVPPCEPAAPGGLDLAAGCVDDVCVGASLAAVTDAWGEPLSCADASPLRTCAWAGVLVTFDADDDAVTAIGLGPERPTATADGLATGVSVACALDRLDAPETVGLSEVDGGWRLASLEYGTFSVVDQAGPDEAWPDGLVDWISVWVDHTAD